MKSIKTYILALLLLMGAFTHAQVPKPMKPVRLVNDFAGVFSKSEQNRLEQKLIRFDSETSTQIAIVTMKDLDGYAPQDMATRIMEEWGVGGKENNGFVILFKPKTSTSNGEVFITTGYGVEQFVTDALAKKIVEYDMIPNFKSGNIFKGIDVATSSLISLTTGEFTGSQYLESRKKSAGGFPWLFFLVFIVFPILFGRRRRNVSSMSGRGSSLPFWLLLGAMGSGRSHGGSFGNFNSGGGSFGGFGGGLGGGGGAGGSW